MRARRRIAVGALIVLLAGAVVLAHSAAAGDHMGDAMAACLAVMDAAALGILAVAAARVTERVRAVALPSAWTLLERAPARRPWAPPWPRGSPFALQVLRL